MVLFHLFRTPALPAYQTANLLAAARGRASRAVRSIDSESCYNVASRKKLTADQMRLLRWLLAETFEPENFAASTFFSSHASRLPSPVVLEVGPRMNFTTAWLDVIVYTDPGRSPLEGNRRSTREVYYFLVESLTKAYTLPGRFKEAGGP